MNERPDVTFAFLDKSEKEALLDPLFALFYENMRAYLGGGSFEEERTLWKREVGPALDRAPRKVVLVHEGGELAGFLMYYTNEKTFMIEEAQLRRDLCGKGVMRRLFAFLAPFLPAGIPHVEAFTHRENLLPNGILRHLGFVNAEDDGGPFLRWQADCAPFLARCLANAEIGE